MANGVSLNRQEVVDITALIIKLLIFFVWRAFMMEEKASFIHSNARLEEDGGAVLGDKAARLCDRDGSTSSILYITVSQHSMENGGIMH